MRRDGVLFAAAGLAWGAVALCAERELVVPGARDRAVVRIPEAEPPRGGWPAMFFWHGMGGRPTISPLAALPAATNVVLVGMAYAEPEPVARTRAEHEAWLGREWAVLLETRRAVGRLAPLANDALYIGGVSMGGWLAAALFDRHPADHAGLVVLLAGRRSDDPRPSSRTGLKGRSVYVGAGETDPNLAAARRAATFYRAHCAQVTFEMFEGVGHHVPPRAPRLEAWLLAETIRRRTREEVRALLASWWAEARAALASETDVRRRVVLLETIREDPRCALCGPEAAAELNRIAAALARDPEVIDRWNAERELEQWLIAEWAATSLDALRTVREGLASLVERHPSAPAARFARLEGDVLDRLLAQSRSVVVHPATSLPPTQRLPSSPLRARGVPPLRRR